MRPEGTRRRRAGATAPFGELRELDEDALHALEPVRRAFVLRLRTYAVVSVGFDRLAGREVPESD